MHVIEQLVLVFKSKNKKKINKLEMSTPLINIKNISKGSPWNINFFKVEDDKVNFSFGTGILQYRLFNPTHVTEEGDTIEEGDILYFYTSTMPSRSLFHSTKVSPVIVISATNAVSPKQIYSM
eukprot:GHVR01154973.1.p1 GENE.GHVR01154973.1~~GHVR01154973.1.p1  ORF type:complete len:123 (+),score=20.04 GHVR01154973.1:202-570(+)